MTELTRQLEALENSRFGLELAIEYVLHVFLVLTAFLCGKDLEHLCIPRESHSAKSAVKGLASIGGLRPNALARFHRSMRVVPMQGPYLYDLE